MKQFALLLLAMWMAGCICAPARGQDAASISSRKKYWEGPDSLAPRPSLRVALEAEPDSAGPDTAPPVGPAAKERKADSKDPDDSLLKPIPERTCRPDQPHDDPDHPLSSGTARDGCAEDDPVFPAILKRPENGRFGEMGGALMHSSWLNHPFSGGVFLGGLSLEDPIPGAVQGGVDVFSGVRAGWDFSHFTGLEARVAFASVGVETMSGFHISDCDTFFGDISLLVYPWGDTQWRPFVGLGTGVADLNFTDDLGLNVHETIWGMPITLGMKYRYSSRLVFRLDLTDNIAFGSGSGLGTLNNLSATGGLEFRFGGPQRLYWPWDEP